ncbi:transposase [Bradyrhizobium diazoefficiens]
MTLQRDLKRARIVLLAADGRSTRSIAKEVGVQPRIVMALKGCKTSRGLASSRSIRRRPTSGF